MICCRPSRRDVVRWSAVVASASLVPVLDGTPARAADNVRPVNLELVTVTETTAMITWYTGVPGTDDGLGRMEPAPSDAWSSTARTLAAHPTAHGPSGTPYHYVEMTGLEPGQTYYYKALSRGRAATPTSLAFGGNAAGSPRTATVLRLHDPAAAAGPVPLLRRPVQRPAPGRDRGRAGRPAPLDQGHLARFPASRRTRRSWRRRWSTTRAAAARAYLLAAGDITSEAAPADLGRGQGASSTGSARSARDYFVARGNHDRAHRRRYRVLRRRAAGQRLLPRRLLPGADGPTYFARELAACASSASTPTTSPATAATRAALSPSSWPGSEPS